MEELILLIEIKESDLETLKIALRDAEYIYAENFSKYEESQKTKDSIKIDREYHVVKTNQLRLNNLRSKIAELSSEILELKHADFELNKPENPFSSLIGDDLNTLQTKINQALADYEEKNNRYLASPHTSWAKRNLLPGVNQAKDYLDTLKRTYEEMQSSMSKGQSIDLVDLTMNKAEENTQTEMPWKTIGLAVGALAIIIVIVKVV